MTDMSRYVTPYRDMPKIRVRIPIATRIRRSWRARSLKPMKIKYRYRADWRAADRKRS